MTTAFQLAVDAVRSGASVTVEAERLLSALTPQERLWLLDGDMPFWEGQEEMMTQGYNARPYVHGEIERLGIPGYRFADGPRGVVVGQSTAFPVSMSRGASWDVDLEERIGEAIGREVVAQDANFFAGVCVNLLRHPAWGRAQETYGEVSHHVGELGAALTRGVQRHAMACVKHYALNSMENARFVVDVTAADDALHEIYLAHFRRIVDEGVAGVMTAYNSVNGEWAGQNRVLLTDILRDQWGFEGVTVSDFGFGLRDAGLSLEAGLDIEEPSRQIRAEHLESDLEAGRATWAAVDRSALRILATQIRFAAEIGEQTPDRNVIAGAAHRALAREAAARGMVLLRNEDVDGTPALPLDRKIAKLAVIGRLSDVANTGDHGSSDVRAPYVVTPLEGLRAALPDTEIVHVDADDAEEAARVAADCDAAIIIAGYTADDEGEFADLSGLSPELSALLPPRPDGSIPDSMTVAGSEALAMGGDRERLTLRPIDEEIIAAVSAANTRTVVAIIAAGAVLTENWRHLPAGIVMAWYSGMEGGAALADVLLGDADPSGRLPFAIPTDESHLPFFDRDATEIVYDRWHGQRLLDRLGVDAAFPLGFGLSYSSFTQSDASIERLSDVTAELTVTVRNTGSRTGWHVVQAYAIRPGIEDRVLLGFATVELEPGASQRVTAPLSLLPLGVWDADARSIVVPDADVDVDVSAYSGDRDALHAHLPRLAASVARS